MGGATSVFSPPKLTLAPPDPSCTPIWGRTGALGEGGGVFAPLRARLCVPPPTPVHPHPLPTLFYLGFWVISPPFWQEWGGKRVLRLPPGKVRGNVIPWPVATLSGRMGQGGGGTVGAPPRVLILSPGGEGVSPSCPLFLGSVGGLNLVPPGGS